MKINSDRKRVQPINKYSWVHTDKNEGEGKVLYSRIWTTKYKRKDGVRKIYHLATIIIITTSVKKHQYMLQLAGKSLGEQDI